MLCAARALFGALRRAAAGCLQCTAVRSHGCASLCYGFRLQLARAKVDQALDRWHQRFTHYRSVAGARLQRLRDPSVTLGPGRRGLSFGFLVDLPSEGLRERSRSLSSAELAWHAIKLHNKGATRRESCHDRAVAATPSAA